MKQLPDDIKAAIVAYLRFQEDREAYPDGQAALSYVAEHLEAGGFEAVCQESPAVANGTYGNPNVHALRLIDDFSAIARERGPEWFCNCGHRATSAEDHAAHVAQVTP